VYLNLCNVAPLIRSVLTKQITMAPLDATKKYKSTLDSVMSFAHGLDAAVGNAYGPARVYSAEELYALTPTDVVRWMKMKAYGTPDPVNDANPTMARSKSLKYWKKAISFFMPNRLMVWNEARLEGNPTRCMMVNELLKAVKRKEARKQGAKSKTRRPMKASEFVILHDILKAKVGNDIWRYGMTAFVQFPIPSHCQNR